MKLQLRTRPPQLDCVAPAGLAAFPRETGPADWCQLVLGAQLIGADHRSQLAPISWAPISWADADWCQ